MAWPLVVTGMALGFAMIMFQVRSPMLVAIGMYLPFPTTFAIFVGGIAKWVTDTLRDRGNFNEAQSARMENIGVLCASGMIAGEALVGLVIATFRFFEWPVPRCLPNAVVCGRTARDGAHPVHSDPHAAGESGRSERTGAADGDYVGG